MRIIKKGAAVYLRLSTEDRYVSEAVAFIGPNQDSNKTKKEAPKEQVSKYSERRLGWVSFRLLKRLPYKS